MSNRKQKYHHLGPFDSKLEKSNSMRSNKLGIGIRVWVWTQISANKSSGHAHIPIVKQAYNKGNTPELRKDMINQLNRTTYNVNPGSNNTRFNSLTPKPNQEMLKCKNGLNLKFLKLIQPQENLPTPVQTLKVQKLPNTRFFFDK